MSDVFVEKFRTCVREGKVKTKSTWMEVSPSQCCAPPLKVTTHLKVMEIVTVPAEITVKNMTQDSVQVRRAKL